MSTFLVCWSICSYMCLFGWLIVSIFESRGDASVPNLFHLFHKKGWAVKVPILLVFLEGIFWPVFFENLAAKTMICRQDGRQIKVDAMTTASAFRRMAEGDFLILDPSYKIVWETSTVRLSTPDGAFKLLIFLKFDGTWDELVEEAKLLAPCVPKGESDLVPTLQRKLESMRGELGNQFMGTIMEPDFRLYGYRVDRVEVQSLFPSEVSVAGKPEQKFLGDTNIIDWHKSDDNNASSPR